MTAMGHELPRHLAERAAVMPPKAAAPSRDQGGRGGPLGDIGPLIRSRRRRYCWRSLAPGAGCCACRGYAKDDAKVRGFLRTHFLGKH